MSRNRRSTVACCFPLLSSAVIAFAVVAVIGVTDDAMAQSSRQSGVGVTTSQPTLLTPRVGGGGVVDPSDNQQGSLPPQPEFTPEQRKYLLRMRMMNIEGGRSYVRQVCNDPTWVEDYQKRLADFKITEKPDAITAFKEGWNDSKSKLGTEIVGCEELLGAR